MVRGEHTATLTPKPAGMERILRFNQGRAEARS
jgi:hypothetical protein